LLRSRLLIFTLLLLPVFADAQKGPQKNHLFLYQFGYTSSYIGKAFGPQGCISTIGFNPAGFFSNKLVLGIVADIKLIPGLKIMHASDKFLDDFNAAFVSPHGPGLDSANAQVVLVNLNNSGRHTYGIRGYNMFYFGVMFSLLPHKAGALMLQVKRGTVGYEAHALIFENAAIPNISGNDKYPFTISKSWKYELTLKPQAFFTDVYTDVDDLQPGDFWKTFSISFFYEKINFKTAEFNGTKFSTFLTNDFMTKYAYDNRFGFKVGFSLY
jgi:hypothetical protein